MKIPVKCPHRRSGKNWIPAFRREPDAPPCCRTSDYSITPFLPKRGPLCENLNHTIEVYRFTWRSSFNGDASVQIGRGEKNIIIDWACASFNHGNGRFRRCLERADWDRLEAALVTAGFWALDPCKGKFGLDGATWTIEGRRRDVYRVVERWSPGSAIYDLGRTFFDLAGPPIADIGLY
jgi:hypothetical protein